MECGGKNKTNGNCHISMGMSTGEGNVGDEDNNISYQEILDEAQLKEINYEFSRLKNACYLDHGGATLYAKSQMDASSQELQSSLFSNPHSRNPSSTITTDAIDYVRHRILSHFGTTGDDYSVIFTSGATSAIKLVAESFNFNGGLLAYLEESHTSVVGMREYLLKNRVTTGSDSDDRNGGDWNGRCEPPYSSPSKKGVKDGRVYCISKSTLDKLMEPRKSLDCEAECSCSSNNTLDHLKEPHLDPEQHLQSLNDGGEGEEALSSLGINNPRGVSSGSKKMKRNPACSPNALLAYPAQCNFSGWKYPLEWIAPVQIGHLEGISQMDHFYLDKLNKEEVRIIKNACPHSTSGGGGGIGGCNLKNGTTDQPSCTAKSNGDDGGQGHKWFVMLDGASFVASSRLDLSKYPADFVPISFYKMFGWPTGLGALLVRNSSAYVLEKRYFGGGTVNISIPSSPFHAKRAGLHERFEDGTIPFLTILAVRHGLDTLTKLCGPMEIITTRTFRLAQYFFRSLSNLKYPDGQPVARIYSDSHFQSEKSQGPVVTFNLLRNDGSIIGYSEMEQIAYLHDVHLRYGCFCNPGACRRHLGHTPQQILKHYEAGHVCGDLRDIIDGEPTGAIRASFGYMTTLQNIHFLLQLIYKSWIKPIADQINRQQIKDPLLQGSVQRDANRDGSVAQDYMRLVRMFVYPVKSCGAFEVKSNWPVGPCGLLYDREWLIMTSAGVPLTTKREPGLCLVQPTLDLERGTLTLSMEGFEDIEIPLDMNAMSSAGGGAPVQAELCTSKVCGEKVIGVDCGEPVGRWLSRVLDKSGLKLIRMSGQHQRKPRNPSSSSLQLSLANQSQFLLLSMESLGGLARELISKGVLSSLLPNLPNTEIIIISSTSQENGSYPPGNSDLSPNLDDRSSTPEDDKGDEREVIKGELSTTILDGGIQKIRDPTRESGLVYNYREEAKKDVLRNGEERDVELMDGKKGTYLGLEEHDGNYYENEEGLIRQVVETLIGRFRGNLVVSSSSKRVNNNISDYKNVISYAEESWDKIRIGSLDLKSGGPCVRCATICMDPWTGNRSSEPLLTLSETRGGRPNFGIHLYLQNLPEEDPPQVAKDFSLSGIIRGLLSSNSPKKSLNNNELSIGDLVVKL